MPFSLITIALILLLAVVVFFKSKKLFKKTGHIGSEFFHVDFKDDDDDNQIKEENKEES